jgi:DNA-binding XRE family transcriptional regulator
MWLLLLNLPHPISKQQREVLKKLGANIKSVRLSKKMTLRDLGYAIDKDWQSIQRLENGAVNPSV